MAPKPPDKPLTISKDKKIGLRDVNAWSMAPSSVSNLVMDTDLWIYLTSPVH